MMAGGPGWGRADTRTAPRLGGGGHANGAPSRGAAAWNVSPELPSVHLLCRVSPLGPGPARLPRLVARGYTGFDVSVRTLRPVTSFFLRRISWLGKPPA